MSRIMTVAALATLAATAAFAGETTRDLDGHAVQVMGGQERSANATLRTAEREILSRLPGVVETVARDNDPSMHYHVDVRLTNGALARLAVAPYTGQLSWRQPAVIRD